MIKKYRKKPVVVEAIQWDGFQSTFDVIYKFCLPRISIYDSIASELEIETLEGNHIAQEGDWIIKGVKGECYPCKPDIFEMTYEEVRDK